MYYTNQIKIVSNNNVTFFFLSFPFFFRMGDIFPQPLFLEIFEYFLKKHLIFYFLLYLKKKFTYLLTSLSQVKRSTHPWPFSESKLNLKSDRVNFVAPASPIECMLYLPNVQAIQYKLGPERVTRLGNSNVLRLYV